MLPLPQRCTSLAHEEATLPLTFLPSPWLLPLQSPLPSPSPLPTPLPLPPPPPIAVAVGHLPLRLPSTIAAAVSVALLSAITVAVALAVGHCRLRHTGHCSYHLHRASPLPLLTAISKRCCLGAARIVFDQLKQRMLTLFYFVWTVGGALIKAG